MTNQRILPISNASPTAPAEEVLDVAAVAPRLAAAVAMLVREPDRALVVSEEASPGVPAAAMVSHRRYLSLLELEAHARQDEQRFRQTVADRLDDDAVGTEFTDVDDWMAGMSPKKAVG